MTPPGKMFFRLGFIVCLALFCPPRARAQSFSFSTLAGNAGYGSADGIGNHARFRNPQGVAVDAGGNVYVADSQNSMIREITPAGVVSTIAGRAGSRGTADGPGGSARFGSPRGLAVDAATNLYVADTLNHTIRKISPVGGVWQVSTIAGHAGVAGITNGTGTNALFRLPAAVAVSSAGSVFVADTYNDDIREITLSGTNWLVTSVAGQAGSAGLLDGTNAGAKFNLPAGIAVDASNNIYVADTANNAIRLITPAGTNWVVTNLVAVGLPGGVSVDASNNLYVSDSADNTIQKIALAGNNLVMTTLAGSSGNIGSADGTNTAAHFYGPQGTAVDGGGTVYVADSLNNTIRKITPAGLVSTLAGLAGGAGSADGTNAFASFNAPQGIALDGQGNVYVADGVNNTIRRAGPMGADWVVTTVAGTAGFPGDTDGTNADALFNNPAAIAVDSGNHIFVADFFNNEIRVITQSETNWIVTTFAGTSGALYSGSITNTLAATNVSAGATNVVNYTNVSFELTNTAFFTNFSGLVTNISGGATNQVFLVTNVPVVTNLSGGMPVIYNLGTNVFALSPIHSLDGSASSALFSQPSGLAFDHSGNLFVADRGNNAIREITPGGIVSTFAGTSSASGSADGTGTNAFFFHPTGLVADGSGNVFVADTDNNTIREITPAGVVTTIAGLAGFSGTNDGVNTGALFNAPQAITLDASGSLYVADTGNSTLRKLTPSGPNWVVSTVGGVAKVPGSTDAVGTNALFFTPQGLTMDTNGNLYVSDTGNNTLRLGRQLPQTAPTLQLARQGKQIILSWPMSAGGYSLETSSSLSPTTWIPVNGIASLGTNFVSTNASTGPAAFYRLHFH